MKAAALALTSRDCEFEREFLDLKAKAIRKGIAISCPVYNLDGSRSLINPKYFVNGNPQRLTDEKIAEQVCEKVFSSPFIGLKSEINHLVVILTFN